MFDPTLPATGSAISSAELRNQFTGLKVLLDAQAVALASLDARVTALEPPPPDHGQATNPSPANGATGVALGFDYFEWLPNSPAQIYMGTTPGMLSQITTATGSGVGLLGAMMMMQWDPTTTYYWRIDLWDPGTGATVTGDEWHFTTGM